MSLLGLDLAALFGDARHADAAQIVVIEMAKATARSPKNVSCDLSGDLRS